MEISWNFVSPKKWEPWIISYIVYEVIHYKFNINVFYFESHFFRSFLCMNNKWYSCA